MAHHQNSIGQNPGRYNPQAADGAVHQWLMSGHISSKGSRECIKEQVEALQSGFPGMDWNAIGVENPYANLGAKDQPPVHSNPQTREPESNSRPANPAFRRLPWDPVRDDIRVPSPSVPALLDASIPAKSWAATRSPYTPLDGRDNPQPAVNPTRLAADIIKTRDDADTSPISGRKRGDGRYRQEPFLGNTYSRYQDYLMSDRDWVEMMLDESEAVTTFRNLFRSIW